MQMTEQAFRSRDDTELFYRAWLPQNNGAPPEKALLLFHRGHEHSARWQETVESLQLENVAVFAWDQRGHGKSPGARGSAENLSVVIRDADRFARHVCNVHGIAMENVVVMAHSVGAVIATAWVHDFAPRIRGLILGTPAFRVKLYVPLALPALRIKQKLLKAGYVKSYVKVKMLTHDPRQAEAYQADPLIFRQIAVNILLDLHDTSTRLMDDAGAITIPTLMLAAGRDWVVKVSAQQAFFRRLGSPIKQMEIFPEFSHAIFHEKGRHLLIERVRRFIDECFVRPAEINGLLHADQGGFTRTEYDLLRLPGAMHWGIARAALKTFGRLSDGVSLGWQTGFDSGVTLDYVYKNKPSGGTLLGRLIDNNYLNSIGWRGIRVRRENLQCALRRCIKEMHHAGRPVHIVDVAAGAGRYVLETMESMLEIPVSATLRDYKQENLDAARQLCASLKLKDVRIEHGDAFDRASLASITPRPSIAIVSGLFELIPDNERILRTLRGLADAVEDGGYLIYTNQPWHPQVEFIARVLRNREGQPWIMRRRTQAEMDELVRSCGFEKVDQDIDRWGIFTVSVARRVAR
jgi:alpha-beta hydrolase superfamily lysophospholipase